MRGGKHVKVKKRRPHDTLRFRADARKLILGSIGIPLEIFSVKVPLTKTRHILLRRRLDEILPILVWTL